MKIISGDRYKDGLVKHFKDLNPKKGVEIGVLRGEYSEYLLKHIPGLTLYCIDPWRVYDGYTDIVDGLDNFYDEAVKRLKPYNARIIRALSSDAVQAFDDSSLDFVYIDGAHDYKHVTEDIDLWSKKIRKGGIISGHDYVVNPADPRIEVKKAVDDWVQKHAIENWFVITDGKRNPSWFWVV
jgi:predicted O-methyltransferase YrrM